MNFFQIIAILFIVMSCSSEIQRIPEPKNLIPKEKMIVVVREMVKLESLIENKYSQLSVYHKVMVKSGDSLLKANHVTRKQYESSIDYYGSRQDEMKEIYSRVLEDLNKELGEIEAEVKE